MVFKSQSASMDDQAGGQSRTWALAGEWRHSGVTDISRRLYGKGFSAGQGAVQIDLSGVTGLDTTGAWLVKRLTTLERLAGNDVSLIGGRPEHRALVEGLPDQLPGPNIASGPQKTLFQRLFEPLGRETMDLWQDMVAAMYILGSAVKGGQMKIGRRGGISVASIVAQIDHMGVRAVPIILLMSFLIGAIIAQQGAFQLRYFGAEVFVVDLVGILQLREIGVLLTAIMIAGRSGSAITAEIGSMKMREEVDALTVMGLNPVGVLVFPRLIALVISLPLLTILANFAALGGAAAVSWAYSGITLDVFLNRLQQAIDISTIISGMIKAPFMALIIGVVAAVEGMKTGGSAESLGKRVTASVVKSIFVVILVDGLFAMFYAAIDF